MTRPELSLVKSSSPASPSLSLSPPPRRAVEPRLEAAHLDHMLHNRVRKNRLQIANTPPSATNSRQISKLEVERHPAYGIAALWPADDDIAALLQA
jgi:hypothetical protein